MLTIDPSSKLGRSPTPLMSLGSVPDSYQRLLSIYLPVTTLGHLGSTCTWSSVSCRPRLRQLRPRHFCWPSLPAWAVLQVTDYLEAPDISGTCATNLYTSRAILPVLTRGKWYVTPPCACFSCRPWWARSLRANQVIRRRLIPIPDRASDAESSPRGYNSDDDPRPPEDFVLQNHDDTDSGSDSPGMPRLMPAPVAQPPPHVVPNDNRIPQHLLDGPPWNRVLSHLGSNGWNLVGEIWDLLGCCPPGALNRLTNIVTTSISRIRAVDSEIDIPQQGFTALLGRLPIISFNRRRMMLSRPLPSNWPRTALGPPQVSEDVFLTTCAFLSPTMLGRLAASSHMTKKPAMAALETHKTFLPPQVLWQLTTHGSANMAGALCACSKPVQTAVKRILPSKYWTTTGPPQGWPWVRNPPPVILRPRGPAPFSYSSAIGFPRQDLATVVLPGNPAVWTSQMRRHWRHTSVHQTHGRRYYSLKLHPLAFGSESDSDDDRILEYILLSQ
jgi:hypothetical protein